MRSRLFSSSTVVRINYPPRKTKFPINSIPAIKLCQTLESLGPISAFAQQQAIRTRPKLELQKELDSWRRACSISHESLSGELYYRRGYFLNSVIRIVANTMRLLMELGHYTAAQELDRAFFTRDKAQKEFIPQIGKENYQILSHYRLGDGLGLSRKGIQLAWIQGLSLRLESGLYEDESEFGNLLHSLYQNERGDMINLVIVSFLIRKLAYLYHRSITEGEDAVIDGRKIGIQRIEDMWKLLRESEFGGDKMVLSADLESIIQGYSAQSSGNDILGTLQFNQLESRMKEYVDGHSEQQLVGDLIGERKTARIPPPTHSFSPISIPTTSSDDDSTSVVDRAHTLYLATQFLLLKADLSTKSIDQSLERRPQVAHLLRSAIAIYTNLLDILPTVSPTSTEAIIKIRQRQLSSLYKILWASVGIFDLENSPAVKYGAKESQELNVEQPDYETITRILEMILRTKKVLVDLKPMDLISREQTSQFGHIAPKHLVDPRLLLISSNFFRRLLFSLALPSTPSRRAPPFLPATKSPWALLRQSLSLVLECREYDGKIGLPYYLTGKKSIKEALLRRALILNLVRATILGGGDHLEEEGSVESRLRFLLNWFQELEEYERVDRKIVEAAVGLVLKQEWNGAAWTDWKANLRGIVKDWVEGVEGAEVE